MTNKDLNSDETKFSRRGFCNVLLVTSAAFLTTANRENSAATLTSAAPTFPEQKIEGAEAMQPGSFLLFVYPSRNDAAILVRTNDGKYFAHGQKCSHLGCSVNFNRELRCLQCPCHSGAYDLQTGSVLYGPPTRRLDHIFLEFRGGEVWAVGRTNNPDRFTNTGH